MKHFTAALMIVGLFVATISTIASCAVGTHEDAINLQVLGATWAYQNCIPRNEDLEQCEQRIRNAMKQP